MKMKKLITWLKSLFALKLDYIDEYIIAIMKARAPGHLPMFGELVDQVVFKYADVKDGIVFAHIHRLVQHGIIAEPLPTTDQYYTMMMEVRTHMCEALEERNTILDPEDVAMKHNPFFGPYTVIKKKSP